MLNLVWQKQKEKKYIIMNILISVFFLVIYIMLDRLGNENYTNMIANFGLFVVIIHMLINIIISILTGFMMTLSTIKFDLTKREAPGSNVIPMLSFLFGVLTYGCTSCVVTFLAAVGISFTPLILPNGNLAWKLASLAIIILGFIIVLYSINKATCKIPNKEN